MQFHYYQGIELPPVTEESWGDRWVFKEDLLSLKNHRGAFWSVIFRWAKKQQTPKIPSPTLLFVRGCGAISVIFITSFFSTTAKLATDCYHEPRLHWVSIHCLIDVTFMMKRMLFSSLRNHVATCWVAMIQGPLKRTSIQGGMQGENDNNHHECRAIFSQKSYRFYYYLIDIWLTWMQILIDVIFILFKRNIINSCTITIAIAIAIAIAFLLLSLLLLLLLSVLLSLSLSVLLLLPLFNYWWFQAVSPASTSACSSCMLHLLCLEDYNEKRGRNECK